jgi:5-methylcytosine-specific restriction endonuclease McrA
MRRYQPIAKSRGTAIPPDLRKAVLERDRWRCIGHVLNFPTAHLPVGELELDHVRASHGMGMKSETTAANLVSLCAWCHRWKTQHGREARPLLLAYLSGQALHAGETV